MKMTITEKYIDFGGNVYFFERIDKLPRTVDNAFLHHIAMDCRSWTFLRMTEEEQIKCIDTLRWAMEQRIIKGTYETRWRIMNGLYYAFLEGLGYDGGDWRETA